MAGCFRDWWPVRTSYADIPTEALHSFQVLKAKAFEKSLRKMSLNELNDIDIKILSNQGQQYLAKLKKQKYLDFRKSLKRMSIDELNAIDTINMSNHEKNIIEELQFKYSIETMSLDELNAIDPKDIPKGALNSFQVLKMKAFWKSLNGMSIDELNAIDIEAMSLNELFNIISETDIPISEKKHFKILQENVFTKLLKSTATIKDKRKRKPYEKPMLSYLRSLSLHKRKKIISTTTLSDEAKIIYKKLLDILEREKLAIEKERLEREKLAIEKERIAAKKANVFNSFNPVEGGETTLYYLRLSFKEKNYYKVGVTLKNVQSRYNKQDFKVIQKVLYEKRLTHANTIEKKILTKFKDHLFPLAILSSGHTEVFDKDVLNMDK